MKPDEQVTTLLDAAQQGIRENNPLPVVQCLVDASYFLAGVRDTAVQRRLSNRLMRLERDYKASLTDLLAGTAGVEWVVVVRRGGDNRIVALEKMLKGYRIPVKTDGDAPRIRLHVPGPYAEFADDRIAEWDAAQRKGDQPPAPPRADEDEPAPNYFGTDL